MTTSEQEFAAAKERARTTWDAGEFGAIARLIPAVGDDIVMRTRIASGEEVLDVACGTGNATLPAARTGAQVHGLDIAPGLLAEARANAEAAGLEIDFVLGDAEALPWPEGTFDVVTSTFGCMFAPRHEVAAAEIARVLKPGGRIGLCCWVPDGRIGQFFMLIGSHLPPQPEWFRPPPFWGVPDYVTGLFEGTGVEPQFERSEVEFTFDSPEAAVAEYEHKFGPLVMAMEALGTDERRQALRDDLLAYFQEVSTTDDGGHTIVCAEYLVITGEKAAG